MKRLVRSVGWIASLFLLLVATGCPGGSGGYTVKGKVTHGGQPLSFADGGGAAMSFVDVSSPDKIYSCSVNPDSTYEVEVPAGKYTVGIQIFDKDRNDKLGNKYMPGASSIVKEVTGSVDNLDIDVPVEG
jgi:hypothetical protein